MEQRDRGRYDSAYNPFTGQYELRDRYRDLELARVSSARARHKAEIKRERRERRREKIRTYLIWALIGAALGILSGFLEGCSAKPEDIIPNHTVTTVFEETADPTASFYH